MYLYNNTKTNLHTVALNLTSLLLPVCLKFIAWHEYFNSSSFCTEYIVRIDEFIEVLVDTWYLSLECIVLENVPLLINHKICVSLVRGKIRQTIIALSSMMTGSRTDIVTTGGLKSTKQYQQHL